MKLGERLETIGQIADAVGVATSTLRYYEREGLLKPAGRSVSGYRLYDPNATERLRFIRTQAVGFSLDDIKTLLSLDERTTCKTVQALIKDRLADVAHRIAQLESVERTLSQALDRCQRARKGCPVLDDLTRNLRVKS